MHSKTKEEYPCAEYDSPPIILFNVDSLFLEYHSATHIFDLEHSMPTIYTVCPRQSIETAAGSVYEFVTLSEKNPSVHTNRKKFQDSGS